MCKETAVIGLGLKMLWRGFVAEIKDSWQQSYRDTYDVCIHPPAMCVREFQTGYVECGVCGRVCNRRQLEVMGAADAKWWTREEMAKPHYFYSEPVAISIGGHLVSSYVTVESLYPPLGWHDVK